EGAARAARGPRARLGAWGGRRVVGRAGGGGARGGHAAVVRLAGARRLDPPDGRDDARRCAARRAHPGELGLGHTAAVFAAGGGPAPRRGGALRVPQRDVAGAELGKPDQRGRRRAAGGGDQLLPGRIRGAAAVLLAAGRGLVGGAGPARRGAAGLAGRAE